MDQKSEIKITMKHSVFISYSRDSEEHIEWVRNLAKLITKSGVQVVFDEKDFFPGDPLPRMMAEAITKCEYVIIICTPQYKMKSEKHIGGVEFEGSIIAADLFENQNHRKYIPVYFDNDRDSATPIWAKGKRGIIFPNRAFEQKSIVELIKSVGGSIEEDKLTELIPMYDPSTEITFYNMSLFWQHELLSHLENSVGNIDINDIDDLFVMLEKIDRNKVSEEIGKRIDQIIELYTDEWGRQFGELELECCSFD